jgi:hypothetical protein
MEELNNIKHVLTYNNILLPYKKTYKKEYLNKLKEVLKEKDFLKYVAYANKEDFFYSVYSPYFFYNKKLDAHIYYKYIYNIDKIRFSIYIGRHITANYHIERIMLKKDNITHIISYYPDI